MLALPVGVRLKFRDLREVAWYLWDAQRDKPYLGDGDGQLGTFLIVDTLKAVGILPRIGVWSAEGLATHFKETDRARPGCLLFYNRDHRIGHVVIVWAVVGEHILVLGSPQPSRT
ncbi:hypothetical protein LCGC14_1615010 [marine sediment metagenome]|uniref:NlpC/P60 domain-containing protein n=1 Tax=marine sediment metagenome TaxID=412755 RepID=A0A0F9I7D6_9ZZZZ